MSAQPDANPELHRSEVGSPNWRAIAEDLASALERLNALYIAEQDADAPIHQPEWLRCSRQRYWRAVDVSPGGSGTQLAAAPGSAIPPVLDACCGSRMFWFNKRDDRALFIDKRRETLNADTREGRRQIVVDPDIIADFRSLPFDNGTFTLVVFDPPHTFAGPNGWTAKKYGRLPKDWKDQISAGFRECFRVLAPQGTLIFKWNEHRVPVSSILALTPERPLFGHRCGTTARTHWIVWLKSPNAQVEPRREAAFPRSTGST